MPLVLTRKVGESIYIGYDTRVTVSAVHRGGARLVIDAPRRIPIFREAPPPEDAPEDKPEDDK